MTQFVLPQIHHLLWANGKLFAARFLWFTKNQKLRPPLCGLSGIELVQKTKLGALTKIPKPSKSSIFLLLVNSSWTTAMGKNHKNSPEALRSLGGKLLVRLGAGIQLLASTTSRNVFLHLETAIFPPHKGHISNGGKGGNQNDPLKELTFFPLKKGGTSSFVHFEK